MKLASFEKRDGVSPVNGWFHTTEFQYDSMPQNTLEVPDDVWDARYEKHHWGVTPDGKFVEMEPEVPSSPPQRYKPNMKVLAAKMAAINTPVAVPETIHDQVSKMNSMMLEMAAKHEDLATKHADTQMKLMQLSQEKVELEAKMLQIEASRTLAPNAQPGPPPAPAS